jgi:hypothetical protein
MRSIVDMLNPVGGKNFSLIILMTHRTDEPYIMLTSRDLRRAERP